MIPPIEPGNLNLLLVLCFTLALPLAVLSTGIFFVLRSIPSRPVQVLIPLVTGIILCAVYSSVDPSNPEKFGVFMFVAGMLTHPLLVLPPMMLLQQYLRRIPVPWAVFLAAGIAICLILVPGALQGDQRYEPAGSSLWQQIRSVTFDLGMGSVASAAILGLDRLLSENSGPANGLSR